MLDSVTLLKVTLGVIWTQPYIYMCVCVCVCERLIQVIFGVTFSKLHIFYIVDL